MLKFLFKRPDGVPAPAPVPVAKPAPVAPVAPAAADKVVDHAAVVPVEEGAAKPATNGFRSDHKSLYRQLLRGLYDAILITDPKGHVIDGNDRVAESFQFGKNEVWDMEIAKLIPGITRQLMDRVRQGLAEDRHVMIDARCIRKDGTVFPAEVSISTIDLMNTGDYVFSVRNVEKRKRQLRFSRSLQNALDNDLAAVAVCDAAGLVTYASRAFLTLLGWDKAEMILGKPLAELFPGDAAAWAEACQKANAGERWLGMLHTTTAGQARPLALAAAIARDGSSETESAGMVCSMIEIQEG